MFPFWTDRRWAGYYLLGWTGISISLDTSDSLDCKSQLRPSKLNDSVLIPIHHMFLALSENND